MPIVNGNAGWAEVSNNAVSIDIAQANVTISYIVNNKSIYKFASKDSIYDWRKIELGDSLNIDFFIENGLKKMKLVDSVTEEVPQLNLNHKSETKEIQKRNGCKFDDIYENMFSYGNNEENYIVAMCQAGIMQGDYFDNNQFKSYSKVDGVTVAKVLSLVYNYDEVIKMCADSIYDNNKPQCYVDFAKSKGMISPSGTTVTRYEFYT